MVELQNPPQSGDKITLSRVTKLPSVGLQNRGYMGPLRRCKFFLRFPVVCVCFDYGLITQREKQRDDHLGKMLKLLVVLDNNLP